EVPVQVRSDPLQVAAVLIDPIRRAAGGVERKEEDVTSRTENRPSFLLAFRRVGENPPRRESALERSQPNVVVAAGIKRHERDLLAIGRNIEVVHNDARQEALSAPGLDLDDRKLSVVELAGRLAPRQVVQFLAVGGKAGARTSTYSEAGEAFGG